MADAKPNLIDQFSTSFTYSDIHNMTRNVQVRELLHGPPGNTQLPNDTNHDFTYLYQGAGPHQATQIGDLHLVYDANGNTAFQCRTFTGTCAGSTDISGGLVSHNQLRHYVWTEDDLLRASFDQGSNDPVRFLYDADGQRVAKFQNGNGSHEVSIRQFFTLQGEHNVTKHVFAASTRLASKLMPDNDESDFVKAAETGQAPCGALGSPSCQVVFGPDSPQLAAQTYYFHPNHLGSTSWITDHLGFIHEHLEYFPYGDVWREFNVDFDPGPAANVPPFLFTGKEFDPETGLTYFDARYYDSKLARFISNDPALLKAELREPHLLSGYLYGKANPVRYIDPDGRWACCEVRAYGVQPVHQMAFAGVMQHQLSPDLLQLGKDQHPYMDRSANQWPDTSAQHGLFDQRALPLREVTTEEGLARGRLKAISDANDWIVRNLEIAREAWARGDYRTAVTHGERAGHTMDEGSSPGHKGFQDYALQSPIAHLDAEKKYPEPGTPAQVELEAGVRWRWDIIRNPNVPMPRREDFYGSPEGLLQTPKEYLDYAREHPSYGPPRPPDPQP